jgi:hypothetical protein
MAMRCVSGAVKLPICSTVIDAPTGNRSMGVTVNSGVSESTTPENVTSQATEAPAGREDSVTAVAVVAARPDAIPAASRADKAAATPAPSASTDKGAVETVQLLKHTEKNPVAAAAPIPGKRVIRCTDGAHDATPSEN